MEVSPWVIFLPGHRWGTLLLQRLSSVRARYRDTNKVRMQMYLHGAGWGAIAAGRQGSRLVNSPRSVPRARPGTGAHEVSSKFLRPAQRARGQQSTRTPLTPPPSPTHTPQSPRHHHTVGSVHTLQPTGSGVRLPRPRPPSPPPTPLARRRPSNGAASLDSKTGNGGCALRGRKCHRHHDDRLEGRLSPKASN
jgi:hypothetical protein